MMELAVVLEAALLSEKELGAFWAAEVRLKHSSRSGVNTCSLAQSPSDDALLFTSSKM